MTRRRTALVALSLSVLTLSACVSGAETSNLNYRFEALDQQVAPSPNAEIRVRLVRLADNRPVSGAVITDHRFEMWMSTYKVSTSVMVEGRETPGILAREEGQGVYRVHAQLPMAGSWQATLTARVPGESVPVRGRLQIQVR